VITPAAPEALLPQAQKSAPAPNNTAKPHRTAVLPRGGLEPDLGVREIWGVRMVLT
jgi:hypothetical protein